MARIITRAVAAVLGATATNPIDLTANDDDVNIAPPPLPPPPVLDAQPIELKDEGVASAPYTPSPPHPHPLDATTFDHAVEDEDDPNELAASLDATDESEDSSSDYQGSGKADPTYKPDATDESEDSSSDYQGNDKADPTYEPGQAIESRGNASTSTYPAARDSNDGELDDALLALMPSEDESEDSEDEVEQQACLAAPLTHRPWTKAEDDAALEGKRRHGHKNWDEISGYMKGLGMKRTAVQVMHRDSYLRRKEKAANDAEPKARKRKTYPNGRHKWSKEEGRVLKRLGAQHGSKKAALRADFIRVFPHLSHLKTSTLACKLVELNRTPESRQKEKERHDAAYAKRRGKGKDNVSSG